MIFLTKDLRAIFRFMQKITYASLSSLGDDFHRSFDKAVDSITSNLGKSYPMYIGGAATRVGTRAFQDVMPADTRQVLARFPRGGVNEVRKAIAKAKSGFAAWRDLDWRKRVALLRKAAAIMEKNQVELAALLTLEVGKNRFEAIAEVSESVDLILYYCQQIEEHDGYLIPLQTKGVEQTRSILKPYGVWVVISPFNFPLALATGMAAGALVAGNTVVFKPASDTPLSGLKLYEIFRDAGIPKDVFHFITGGGRDVSGEILSNRDVDGLIFTGSKAVGMHLSRNFNREFPRPCITEMGGKNPAIIMPSANLDDATEGVVRSAFGMGGQKCSACSRVYVHQKIRKTFLELLVEKTARLKVGDPVDKDVFLGPLINLNAVKTYSHAITVAKREGRILTGGRVLKTGDYGRGFFVEPTIVDRLPVTSSMFREEYFAPILAVMEIDSLDQAIRRSNRSEYGLTAGIFTDVESEKEKFFDEIESGVTYCNRRGGATTGAWPGVQSFGGWKGSGSTGKSALGPYYVAQFMREQSQTSYRKS
jgi:1-pyrroline-5-carboxylate dehydrogenase